jgi:hypothetical protein
VQLIWGKLHNLGDSSIFMQNTNKRECLKARRGSGEKISSASTIPKQSMSVKGLLLDYNLWELPRLLIETAQLTALQLPKRLSK